jgi:hypothetical protein
MMSGRMSDGHLGPRGGAVNRPGTLTALGDSDSFDQYASLLRRRVLEFVAALMRANRIAAGNQSRTRVRLAWARACSMVEPADPLHPYWSSGGAIKRGIFDARTIS